MSFTLRLSPRKRASGRFIGRVRDELIKAFLEAKAERGLTQRQLADDLGVDRARVSRALKGEENLTLRSVAEFASALDREIVFSLTKRSVAPGQNIRPVIRQEIGTVGDWEMDRATAVDGPAMRSAM